MPKNYRSFSEIISEYKGFTSNEDGKKFKSAIKSNKTLDNDIIVYDGGHGEYRRYIEKNNPFITKRKNLINSWKVFIKSTIHLYNGNDDVISIIGEPNSACSYTFLIVADDQKEWTSKEAFNVWRYMNTKVFKYLLMITSKGGQSILANKYKYIPVLDWNSEIFNAEDLDEELYRFFNLDRARIESWYSTLRPSPSLTKYVWDENLEKPILVTDLVADPSDNSDEVEDEEFIED